MPYYPIINADTHNYKWNTTRAYFSLLLLPTLIKKKFALLIVEATEIG